MAVSGAVRAGRAFVELFVDDSRFIRGLRRASGRLKAFGAGLRTVGFGMAKAAAGVLIPLGYAGKAFADFEQQMANVATMLDEPEKHMPRLRHAVREMSVEFGESTEALAGGLYDILSASVPAEKAIDVLRASVKAAKAGMTDTKTAADALTTILNSYGLSGEKAADVSDLLFAVVKRGKTTFAELAPSIGMVASTAASAGVSLEELGAMIATLTRNGVRTENAITAVNRTIATFLKSTDESQAYARELGFELNTTTLQAEGLFGVFQRISKLPPEAIAKLFPNIRALRGVIPALKNLRGFENDLGIMTKRAGLTEKAYRKMTDTITHKFNQMKQAVARALSDIGEAFKPVFTDIFQTIRDALKKVGEWIAANEEMVLRAAKVAAAVGAIGAALIALGAVIKIVGIALGAFIGLLKLATIAIKGVGAALIFLAKNPIVLLGAAIAAIVAAFLPWKRMMGSLCSAISGLMPKVRSLTSGIREAADAAKNATGEINKMTSSMTGKELSRRRHALRQELALQQKRNQQAKKAIMLVSKELEPTLWRRQWRYFHESYVEIDRLEKKLAALPKPKFFAIPSLAQMVGGVRAAPGRAIGVMQRAIGSYAKKNAELFRQLRRLEAEGIAEPMKREIALTRLNYEEQIRRAKKAGLDVSLVEKAREMKIAQIRKRYADEANAERLRGEKDLAYNIARLRIEATKTGIQRELALLDLERRRELEQARELGMKTALIEKKYELRRKLVAQPQITTMVRGVFNLSRLQSLQASSFGFEKRIAMATEKTEEHTRKLLKAAGAAALIFAR